jgi:uncharacterized membrane protein YeaQ/YmgE (transglycosylase-associated protein family)
MSILGFVALLIVAAIVGSLGQALAGYSHGGCLVSIVFGFIGAFLGWWLAGILHLPEVFVLHIDGQAFPIVWAIIGSALFAGLLNFLSSGRRYYNRSDRSI